MSEPEFYKDYGWANGWSEEPQIIKDCRKAGHKTRDFCHDHYGIHNEVRCEICKYIYHYDSSG